MYRPETDGVDHINVSICGRTDLGLMLTSEAYGPFTHPRFGEFVSVAGFRGWVVTGQQYDIFRTRYGQAAMATVANYSVVHDENLDSKLIEAITCKLQQTPGLLEMFRENRSLPYVSYGTPNPISFQSELEAWAYTDNLTLQCLTAYRDGLSQPGVFG